MKPRLAFVTPRFGAGVLGGSETVVREMALGLSGRGWPVEILTTTAVDYNTWANVFPPGPDREPDGLAVRRFPTVPCSSPAGEEVLMKIHRGEPTTVDEQITWLNHPYRVPDLFLHLLAHGDDYGAVVFSPYLFWTTTVCMSAVADRSVVIPALHDEPFARLEVIRPVLSDAASVWFMSEPEHQLAHRLGDVASHHVVTGEGLQIPERYDPDGFRRRYGLERPFLLYAGRREAGKGWDWLLSCFAGALASRDPGVDLVTIGSGEVVVPAGLEGRIIDLGFVTDEERNDAYSAALALVQPSRLESFSRSIMESWLAGRPVLARADSEVVGWHCRRSGGGRTFADGEELAGLVTWLTARPDEALDAAAAGRRYVLENFTWTAVLDRIEEELS